MDFDTGRGEWDEDYETKAYVTEETDSGGTKKDQRSDAEPRHSTTRPQRLTVPMDPRPQRPSPTSLNTTEFQAKDDRSLTNLRTPLFQVNKALPTRVQELKASKALPETSKVATKTVTGRKKKSQGIWADTPGLITTRKSRQLAMDADSNKYLGAHPEGVQFQFTGVFRYLDSDLISSQNLNQKWDSIRLGCHVYIYYELGKRIIVLADKEDDCTTALERIRWSLHHAEAEEQSCRPRYIVEPPSPSSMRQEVIASESTEQGAPLTRHVELAGPLLSGEDRNEWEQKRMEIMVLNEKVFMEHLTNAFTKLCALNNSMRMRVQFGNIALTRYRVEMTKPGFPYERFVKMMGQPQTGARFEKIMGGVGLGSKIIQKINQSPDMFCPLDVMIGKLSDIRPKQRILYLTKRGNVTYRLEAEIDISARGEYQLGENSLFEEDSALKKRLEIGFLGFDSKFHWGLEILTKEKLASNSVAIQDTVRDLLSTAEVKQDSLGFPYPILSSSRRLNADDKADIHTMLQYKLIGTPYILEVSLYRGISSETIGHCGACMYSKNWDDHLTPVEMEGRGRWELGSDFQLLFPPPGTSPVTAGNQGTGELSGLRSFLTAVDQVKSFLSDAV